MTRMRSHRPDGQEDGDEDENEGGCNRGLVDVPSRHSAPQEHAPQRQRWRAPPGGVRRELRLEQDDAAGLE